MSKSVAIIVIILLMAGCDKATYTPLDVPEDASKLSLLAQQELDKRFASYRATIARRCKERALKEAITYVDSVIVKELKLKHVDRLSFPNRPRRPKLPEGIILNDSTAIEAI